MTLRVAITRVMPDAERTAARVKALGAEPVIAPLLTIVPCGFNTSVEGAQALIFTSSNGVRAFPAVRDAPHLIILAVGDATAEAARTAGFQDVRSADGDVASLAALAMHELRPTAGKLIHIGGEHLAGDLSGQLQTAGFSVERRVAYSAQPVHVLPPPMTEKLDIVLFHSARAAETFLALGAPHAAELTAGCLSPAVAAAAAATAWKRIIVAPSPREDALLTATLRG
ncbi:MAG: uroporphyrinogen-III synthase [Hyphomonadaceae bacterium]